MNIKRTLIDHVIIQGWMLRNLDLTTKNEVIVYATIFSFSRDGVSEYRGGRKYLAQSLSIPLATLDKVLNKLIDAGLIIKENYVLRNITYSNYKADLKNVVQFLPKDEYNDFEGCTQNDNTPTQNDNTPTQNDNYINKDISNKVNGKPFTPAKLDNLKHPRNFSNNKLTDDLNSLGEIETKLEKRPKKKSLYEKCIDAIDSNEYGFTEDVKQRLRDFLPTTLQAKEYKVNGINQWKFRLKALVQLSKEPSKQIEIIEYSISHSITGFVSPDRQKMFSKKGVETLDKKLVGTDLEDARRRLAEAEDEEYY